MPTSKLAKRALAFGVPVALLLTACGDDDDDTADATVSFTSPADGETVAGGVALAMTAEGITIEEAGEVHEGAGHFHVIADDGCVEPGVAVDRDADHVHFGGGQPEGTIYLEPGSHELCLQVGDGSHIALDATDAVTVEVGITDRDEWCAVIGEVDELFDVTDNSDDEFPVKQVGYENIRRLVAQLADAIDRVDADARDGVTEALEFADAVATAFVEAEDFEAAEQALQPLFTAEEDPAAAGGPWILENCGIDINGEE